MRLWSDPPQTIEPHEAGRLSWGSAPIEESFPEGVVRGERYEAIFAAEKTLEDVSLCLSFQDPEWKREDYLLIPAAVYDGNRFKIKKQNYPPMFDHSEYELDPPVTVTDIPHFEQEGESVISLRAGDSSLPAVFLYHRTSGKGLAFLYECRSRHGALGENGVVLRESEEGLSITIMDPIVRNDGMYRFGAISSKVPCEDKAGVLQKGDRASLIVEQYAFSCDSLDVFFQIVLRLSHKEDPLAGTRTRREPGENGTPSINGGFRLVEQKYNQYNWKKDGAFYQTGEGQNIFSIWQTGWVGGINAAYALYRSGNPVSRGRAKATMDFMFRHMQAPTGFFYGISDGSNIYGDDFYDQDNKAFAMVRKSADALYFSLRILLRMRLRREIPDPLWVQGARKAADAFVTLFQTYRQLGQFIDVDTGRILVGGSAAGALVPAGLLLAAEYFKEDHYRQAAEEIGEMFDRKVLQTGVIGGGPGEILSAPDSESAYALLESYMMLYEKTGQETWLKRARFAAAIYTTWCMPYDYPFPEGSMFQEAGMVTTGAVWANVQNKHGAPGPCTFSGSAMARLSRALNDPIYLRISEDTRSNIPQYLSRANRPLWNYDRSKASPPGFMCERVSTCDWEGFDKIGGVYETGCWCEASLLLMKADEEDWYS